MYGFLSNPDCSSINHQKSYSVSEVYNMTMFPIHLSSSKCINGGFPDGGYDCFISLGKRFCSDLMAEDESRTNTSINNDQDGSSMKEVSYVHDETNTGDDDHSEWLQLSLGGGHIHTTMTTTSDNHRILAAEIAPPLVNLDSFPGVGGSLSGHIQQTPPTPSASHQLFFPLPEFLGSHRPTQTTFLMQPHQKAPPMNSLPFVTLQEQQQQETNYNYLQLIKSFPTNINPVVSSSSSFSGKNDPLHVHRRLNVSRVINPPRRLHSGVWFMLQASQNQAKEPFLPQIPKSYLRIKDGRMTVGLLIKYMVKKLELGSESEIEITCKGRPLLLQSTLQHVRDNIWNTPRNDMGFTVVPQSSATNNHLMVLNYGRIA